MTPVRCLVFLGCLSLGLTGNPSCLPVKKLYKGKSYSADDVPASAVDGAELQVCASGSGAKYCCTKQMERNFEALSRRDFEKAVWTKTDKILLKGLFSKRHKEFDDHFKNLIEKARKSLDGMFKSTYRDHYSQNKAVFMDLFVELESYYNGKNSDLEQVVQSFFEKVMAKMFEIFTDQSYSANFMGCVTKQMEGMKPFGDIPAQLKTQIKKSFVVARTFTQALEVGRDLAAELGKISATTECQKHLVQMSYCSWCRPQYVSLKPCNGLCVDVYKHCLFDLTQVNPHWDSYLKALVDILAKFVGPMSIGNVLGELHMKISSGIMNCQELLIKDRVKISENCKKFVGKSRRSLESSNDFFLEDTSRERREVKRHDERSVASPLERMSLDFRRDIKVATNFWSLLPDAICRMPDITAGVQSNDCWNGTAKGRYSGSKPNQIGSTMSKQISQLMVITQQLRSALQGEEVNVIDGEESGDGSASGSGSASGDGNEIPDFSTPRPTGNENEVDGESEVNYPESNGGDGNSNNPALEARNGNNSGTSVLPSMWLLSNIVVILISRYT